ncbi:MAG: molybdopterin-dependent oxidoreductase [Deltaproteobacteria bacterium]|nr:molybdopterin-dependent oxidoreductase [Deltaproteobacteria bacterium]
MALPAEPVERIFTTCTLDCPDTCSIVVERVGGGAVRLRGNPDHPLTAGFLCQKVGKYYLDRVYSPERVLHPLIREGEGWRRASWDEALDLVAARIREACERYGPLSILDYHRAGSHALLKAMTTRFFNILGGVTTTVLGTQPSLLQHPHAPVHQAGTRGRGEGRAARAPGDADGELL